MVSFLPDHLLYIEPAKVAKSKLPVDDKWTKLMRIAYADAIPGVLNRSCFDPDGRYRGIHTTDCGKISTNTDYLLRSTQITNSLCVFYLRWYRSAIPETEMDKVKALEEHYRMVPENWKWSKEDLVIYFFHTFSKYFFPSKTVKLNRNISDRDLRDLIAYFEKEYADQQLFFSKKYSREVMGVMMDKASGKEAHYAMLAYFNHVGYWINSRQLNLIKKKYQEISNKRSR